MHESVRNATEHCTRQAAGRNISWIQILRPRVWITAVWDRCAYDAVFRQLAAGASSWPSAHRAVPRFVFFPVAADLRDVSKKARRLGGLPQPRDCLKELEGFENQVILA
jgi:hypothetical protein